MQLEAAILSSGKVWLAHLTIAEGRTGGPLGAALLALEIDSPWQLGICRFILEISRKSSFPAVLIDKIDKKV